MAEYRIEYVIQRAETEQNEFVEIGFGSSGTWSDLDACTYSIESAVGHGEWETTAEHPDSDDILREIQASR